MRIITRIILFVAAVCLFACGLFACGGDRGAGRGGDITVQLTYPGSSGANAGYKSVSALSENATSLASYPLDPSNRILIRILGPDFSPMEAWFSRSEGEGVIKNVPPGSKIVVEVDEYDSSAFLIGTNAELLGRGWVQGITLAAGEAKTVDVAMHARGTILTICGAQAVNGQGVEGDSGDGGLASEARISSPQAVKVGPDDSIYISFYSGYESIKIRVRRIDRYGYISHFAGVGTWGSPIPTTGAAVSSAYVGVVSDIDIDPSGNVYFLSGSMRRILKITDGMISRVSVVQGGTSGWFSFAVVNEDELYSVSPDYNRVFQNSGSFIDEFVRDDMPHSSSEPFNRLHYPINGPSGITYASKSNSLIFADRDNNRIMELNFSDNLIRFLVGNETNSGTFQEGVAPRSMAPSSPHIIKFNPITGKIFFVGNSESRVFYITPDNTVRTFAGDGTPGFSGDGSRSDKARLRIPIGVSVDSRGNVYIADLGNYAIRMVVGGALGELPPP